MRFYIKCKVYGGVTGTRISTLKNDAGNVQFFPDRTTAENEATLLNKEMNHPNSKAVFQYWVEPS